MPLNKIVRINSKLYFDLFQKGGDKLIAVYCILKSSRNGEVKYYSYKSKNNKTVRGLNILRTKTSLTLHSIEQYVPMLIDMGLCFIDFNGDFVLIGNKKVNEKFNSRKLVPIKIGRNMMETSYYVVSVRIHSAQKKQENQIKIKLTRSEQLVQGKNPRNINDYRKSLQIIKMYGENIKISEKTVLSNEGFCLLKQGESKKESIKFVKSNGTYWKRKLKSIGLVKTSREFTPIKKMTYAEYRLLRSQNVLEKNHTYKKGFLQEEAISSFKSVDLTKKVIESLPNTSSIPTSKEVYKKKSYLQFDMIDFWINHN